MLRLLANENFPGAAVEALRARGHDVAWVRLDAPGSDDREVLHRAVVEARILLTFDKDFGELAFRMGLPAACGVVLFRMAPRSPAYVAERAVAVLDSRSDWAGRFSVVEEDRIRTTLLPPSLHGKPDRS
jgi:predicted nuclease of predicted toxin-antitoxin system